MKVFLLFFISLTSFAFAQESISDLQIKEAAELAKKLNSKTKGTDTSYSPEWKDINTKEYVRRLLSISAKIHNNTLAETDADLIAFKAFFASNAPDIPKAVYASKMPLHQLTLPMILSVIENTEDPKLKQSILISLGRHAKALTDSKSLVQYLHATLLQNSTNEKIAWGASLALINIDDQAAISILPEIILQSISQKSPVGYSLLAYLQNYNQPLYEAIKKNLEEKDPKFIKQFEEQFKLKL